MTMQAAQTRTTTSRSNNHVVLALVVSMLAMLPALAPLPAGLAPLAPIGLALLPLAALFAFSNPFILCLGFVIFSFFRIHEAFPMLGPLRIPQLLAAPTLIVLLWHVFVQRTIPIYWRREMTVFAIFFALVTIGVPLAANKPGAIAYWTATYWKIAVMTLAIAWLTRRPRDFALASHAFVLAGVAIASVALYNKAHGIGLVEGTRVTIARDIQSVLGDPNDLSLVLLFPLSFAVVAVRAANELDERAVRPRLDGSDCVGDHRDAKPRRIARTGGGLRRLRRPHDQV